MDTIRTQLVFDAIDPHGLVPFWAEALHDEDIHRVLKPGGLAPVRRIADGRPVPPEAL